jgi:hypothetical protein
MMSASLAFVLFWVSVFFWHPTKDALSTIVVTYGAIGCDCAQWAINTKAPVKYREYIYLERGKVSLPLADGLWDGTNIPLQLRLQGHFKPGKGLPEGLYWPRGNPNPARVFRYTSLTILKNGHLTQPKTIRHSNR